MQERQSADIQETARSAVQKPPMILQTIPNRRLTRAAAGRAKEESLHLLQVGHDVRPACVAMAAHGDDAWIAGATPNAIHIDAQTYRSIAARSHSPERFDESFSVDRFATRRDVREQRELLRRERDPSAPTSYSPF
jgi:hypothetical protein